MNIKIQSPAGLPLPDYRVEIVAPPQPFYHIAIRITGVFGLIQLTKIDLAYCTIWIVDYDIDQPITLHGIFGERLCQVCFPIPPSFVEDTQPNAPSPTTQNRPFVYLSATANQTVSLPSTHTRMLLVHYTNNYFNSSAQAVNGNLRGIFKSDSEGLITPHPINAAIEAVFNQVINASPARQIIHLYLEAKVKELLTLLYQLVNPQLSLPKLSEKEIQVLNNVKNIIMTDLSRSYTSYELSKLTGTNAYTLKKNFKAWFGIPLHLFLHNCRMEKATQLLLTTQLSVKEIAFTVGYKNVSNFSEAFKKYYGYAPSKVRESN